MKHSNPLGSDAAPSSQHVDRQGQLEHLDGVLDSAPKVEGRIQLGSDQMASLDLALVRLHELLEMPPVTVPSNFTCDVMRSVRGQEAQRAEPSHARAGRFSWLLAVVGAGALVLALALIGGTSGAEESLFRGLVEALGAVLLAGAGMLAATWSGVGGSIGSWVGASPSVGALLGLAFVGSVIALATGLRRIRQRQNR